MRVNLAALDPASPLVQRVQAALVRDESARRPTPAAAAPPERWTSEEVPGGGSATPAIWPLRPPLSQSPFR